MMMRGLAVGFAIVCSAIVGCSSQVAEDDGVGEPVLAAPASNAGSVAPMVDNAPGVTIGTTPTCCKLVCTDPPDNCDDCTYSCKFDCTQRVPCKIRGPVVATY